MTISIQLFGGMTLALGLERILCNSRLRPICALSPYEIRVSRKSCKRNALVFVGWAPRAHPGSAHRDGVDGPRLGGQRLRTLQAPRRATSP
jgi:hypothetical protein